MVDTAASGSGFREHPLWLALQSYSIGPEAVSLPFIVRLARDNGWTDAHAERVLAEYRRFMFLAVMADHSVTPSDAVDQAWHLHLTYSRDYWERFCPTVLGHPLHHDPTEGGEAQRHHFFDQYARTLRSYAEIFGEEAPANIWPSAKRRLLDDPKARRIHPRDGLVIGRMHFRLLLAVTTLAAAIGTMFVTGGG
jgi:hypothetical protein